ncbi:hypothetical protein BO71DRAFT_431078 [Aspergillus ellipticus CBS 707.79]|uniref:Ubiquinol-cytochrome-c reductase cytochrome c1 n=1 Tax=Aspergillus ellipticus CBS 707.79 TaxID=1448320 RepID=A0A319D7W1_9EURO|nr:hypothetical protein BO71DRAFT_431078 [Aspergillus ellipticus CBS 707.79]
MTTIPKPEQRQIFLACRAIFTGPHANLRKAKTIRARLADHETSLKALIPGFDLNRVLSVVKHFLEKGLFQSDAKAEVEFPGLFGSASPGRETRHEAFEEEAARSVAEVLDGISAGEGVDVEAGVGDEDLGDASPGAAEVMPDGYAVPRPEAEDGSDHTVKADTSIPSLFPSYFPYHAQHSILNTVQRVLEECIFEFTKKTLPSEITSRDIDCAAAVELNKWTRLLLRWIPRLPEGALRPSELGLESTLLTVAKLRHTAVHRLPTTARGIAAFVLVAQRLTEILGDALRTSQLEDLHQDIQDKIRILEMNKNVLEQGLAGGLREIEMQRERLDQQERELKAKTVEDDRENKLMMGLLVEEAMGRIFEQTTVESDEEVVFFDMADDGEE